MRAILAAAVCGAAESDPTTCALRAALCARSGPGPVGLPLSAGRAWGLSPVASPGVHHDVVPYSLASAGCSAV